MNPASPPTDQPGWPQLPLPAPPAGAGLRLWRADDAPALAEAWSDAELGRWLDPPARDLAAAQTWIAGEPSRREQGVALDLVIDHDGTVAGEIGFSQFDGRRRACLVGYWVGAGHRGRGVAAGAVRVATDWMLAVQGANAVVAQCAPANVASHRVAEAAGFELLSADHGGTRVYVRRRPNRPF